MAADTTDRDDPLASLFGEIKTSSAQQTAKPPPKPKPASKPTQKAAVATVSAQPTAAPPVPIPDAHSTIHAVGEAHGFVSREGKRDRRRGRRTKYTENRNVKLTPETYDRLDLLADVLEWQMGKVIDEATQLLLKDVKKRGLIADD